MPIQPRGQTLIGLSFRPPQVDALGLELRTSLRQLLEYPFQLLRLGAYWRRLEPAPNQFLPGELDWQLEAAEASGKQVILCVGAVKCFGYPEFFVPPWRLPRQIREGVVVHTSDHAWLLEPALEFVTRIVERYRDCSAIVGWQIEHESVDTLGLEHSWRLGRDFVSAEIAAVRGADPKRRPILLNGFLPMSNLVAAQQWWRTRDQGDSLAVARRLADIVGIDYYPRHALFGLGGARTVYLDGSASATQRHTRRWAHGWVASPADEGGDRARRFQRRVMISEGQAEPWETATTPPSPTAAAGAASCLPEHVIENFNQCMAWAQADGVSLYAYLFWGAEYWLRRQQSGDPSYLQAFERLLELA